MDQSLQRRILDALERYEPGAIVTVVGTSGSTPALLGARMLVITENNTVGTIGGGELERQAVAEALSANTAVRRLSFSVGAEGERPTGMSCGGSVELLFEPLGFPDRLYIVGAGHCAVALSPLATQLRFDVTVIDHRPEWVNRECHPQARAVVCADYARAAEHIQFDDRCYVVIMTHGHEHDETVLRACLRRPLRYLGMVGSRNKVRQCFDRLLADGFTHSELDRVFAPIGFAVGSTTPCEIAASIAAQLLAVRSGVTSVPFNSNPLLEEPSA